MSAHLHIGDGESGAPRVVAGQADAIDAAAELGRVWGNMQTDAAEMDFIVRRTVAKQGVDETFALIDTALAEINRPGADIASLHFHRRALTHSLARLKTLLGIKEGAQ